MMWPLLMTSFITLSVVIERVIFLVRESRQRDPRMVKQILANVESGKIAAAVTAGQDTQDFVAKPLVYGLSHRQDSFANALLVSANTELKRFGRGLSTLDTIITLAPLLGLLGTVTGLIHAFGLLGDRGLDAPTVITGGISEALIATAFGLFIAIIALIPFNYLNKRAEDARQEIEDAGTYVELLLTKQR
jgi:biopolymer transport protein ExbB